jgi:hypothetical protein
MRELKWLNVASQGFSMLIGQQDKFSWKSLAMTAATALITPPGTGNVLVNIAQAVAVNAAVQGAAIATGLQDKFSWTSVASAGVMAGVSGAASRGLARIGVGGGANVVASSVIAGIANVGARSLLTGTSFGDNIIAALPDIIGQTVGNMMSVGLGAGFRGSGSPGDVEEVDEVVSAKQGVAAAIIAAKEMDAASVIAMKEVQANRIIAAKDAAVLGIPLIDRSDTDLSGLDLRGLDEASDGELYLRREPTPLTPRQERVRDQIRLALSGRLGPNFERQYPLIPHLFRDGKALRGEIAVQFADTWAVGDRALVLEQMAAINQTSRDGHSIQLTFREATYLEYARYQVGLAGVPLIEVQFIPDFRGTNVLGRDAPGSGIITLTPRPAPLVTLHELIHRFGFTHSTTPGDVMFQSAPRNLGFTHLPDSQIRAIVLAYPERRGH